MESGRKGGEGIRLGPVLVAGNREEEGDITGWEILPGD